MAEKRRFLDVWLVESNTVYREVPFTVVVDWVQQGRLLETDKLRWSGQADWFTLGGTPAFAAYVPRSEPNRSEDQAEALEPVEVGFRWKRSHDDEESDPDMIPLIDVSLVLLVVFIMTTAAGGLGANILTPEAQYNLINSSPDMIWIGMVPGKDGKAAPVYSLGRGDQSAAKEDDNLATLGELLGRLDALLANVQSAEINVKAEESLPSGLVRRLAIELEKRPKVIRKFTGVRQGRAQ